MLLTGFLQGSQNHPVLVEQTAICRIHTAFLRTGDRMSRNKLGRHFAIGSPHCSYDTALDAGHIGHSNAIRQQWLQLVHNIGNGQGRHTHQNHVTLTQVPCDITNIGDDPVYHTGCQRLAQRIGISGAANYLTAKSPLTSGLCQAAANQAKSHYQ